MCGTRKPRLIMTLLATIGIAPAADTQDMHDNGPVFDFINETIVAKSQPVCMVKSGEFPAAIRTGLVRECRDLALNGLPITLDSALTSELVMYERKE